MISRWGASPDDWAHFDLVCGLGADLLPVVSNPGATISSTSALKGLGKTPSMYNAAGRVVGIAEWTSRQTTASEINRWMAQADYGICLQTRHVRAIDIDLEDAGQAAEVLALVHTHIPGAPVRSRQGSGRLLAAFELSGDYSKRVLPVGHERIEFLATGQQFVAIGTHLGGNRYEWPGGAPLFPVTTGEVFEALWHELVDRFGTGAAAEMSARRRGATIATDDDTVSALYEMGLALGEGRDGQVYLRCPFEADHTVDSGETATAYFPAGTNGYAQGHFVCLHAHCAGRQDVEFLDALNLRDRDFETLSVEAQVERPLPWPSFVRDKQGRIECTIDNLVKAVSRPDFSGETIRYDTFKDEIVRAVAGGWLPFGDEDYVDLLVALERRGFKRIPKEVLRDVVYAVARRDRFDTAQLWLDGLTWDGVPRVGHFFQRYFGAADNPYHSAVAFYLWSALAGRVVQPGVKADMVPILVGLQGTGKSSAVASLVPDPDFFAEISFAEKEDDRSRKMRGCLVAEIAELRGLHTRDLESIKAFVTSTHEHWVPKFKEFSTVFPRRLVFIGTTNQEHFLADETGNRRWLPVRVGRVDLESLRQDRLQLWAEGRELFAVGGVFWQDAQRLAGEAHDAHRMSDVWEDVIGRWLDEESLDGSTPRSRKFLQVTEVMTGALNFTASSFKRVDEMRVAAILRVLGWEPAFKWVNGKNLRGWKPKTSQPHNL